jgi:hypothetical protein
MLLAKDEAAFAEVLLDDEHRPVLGLVDFNQAVQWSELSGALGSGVPVVAFGSHTDVAGFRQARDAGVARVTSNGDFNRTLPDLIEKYRDRE